MASGMVQTMQTCHNMSTMFQAQMLEEDRVDPFPAKTTSELDEMYEACLRTKEVLAREELIYSKNADFTKYTDAELVAMSAFVRENCRMLSIILAGGAQHFWNGQGLSTTQELKNMYHFVDDKVKKFLLLDQIIETLDIKIKYGRNTTKPKIPSIATHPDALSFSALDTTKAASSDETLLRLAVVCEQFAQQCRAISHTRALKLGDRSRKLDVKEKLLMEIDSVLPMLRKHVLRIGLSKSVLRGGDAQREAATAGGSTAQKLTSLFTHRAVEDAHRDVENSKERLMQEMLFRRAKVERRLEREEEEEAARRKKALALPAGAKARAAAGGGTGLESYNSVFESDEPKAKGLARSGSAGLNRSSSGLDRSPSPTNKSSASEGEKAPKAKIVRKASPGAARPHVSPSHSPRNSPRSNSPSSPKPRGAKSPTKEKSDKGGTKVAKSKADDHSKPKSPTKSARSKKA